MKRGARGALGGGGCGCGPAAPAAGRLRGRRGRLLTEAALGLRGQALPGPAAKALQEGRPRLLLLWLPFLLLQAPEDRACSRSCGPPTSPFKTQLFGSDKTA